MNVVLVTGGNRGLGLELCRQLHARGDDVITTCRESSPELESLGVRVLSGISVDDEASVRTLVAALKGVRLDIIINNAGVLHSETLSDMNFESMRQQFEVNALGPLRITTALLPQLAKGSKVAIITSRMGSLADNTSGGRYGYRMSKAAVNIAGISLAHDLKRRGISVALIHPGMVATRMTGNNGISPAESAAGILTRIEELFIRNTGLFWHASGGTLPW